MPRTFSFNKSRRLTTRREFQAVRDQGSKVRGRFLSLGTMMLEHDNVFRAGFITSRKIGGAVVRNRVRRRLREIVRRHQHEIKRALWLVVIALPPAASVTYDELEAEWLRLAKRASILAD
jgi:ribonuclease P protein component